MKRKRKDLTDQEVEDVRKIVHGFQKEVERIVCAQLAAMGKGTSWNELAQRIEKREAEQSKVSVLADMRCLSITDDYELSEGMCEQHDDKFIVPLADRDDAPYLEFRSLDEGLRFATELAAMLASYE